MEFACKLQLPHIAVAFDVKEMSYGDFIITQKYLQNNIPEDLFNHFDNLLEKYVNLKGYTVSALEKLILLTFLRSISKNGELKLSLKANEVYAFNLPSFINTLLKEETLFKRETINGNKCSVVIGPPQKFLYNTIFEYMYSCIHLVKTGNIVQYYKNLSTDKQEKILEKLPATFTNYLQSYSEKFEERINKIKVPIPTNPFVEDANELFLSAKNGILLEILKLFISSDLNAIYENNYFLISKAHFSIEDLYMLTPGEVDIKLSLLQAEIKEMQPTDPPLNTSSIATNMQ